MSLPLTLPDWMPGWLFLALAVPALLWFLAFLVVPFSVFGVKARLEAIEGELEDLHEELRVMQLRAAGALPVAARSMDPYDDVPHFGQLKRSRAAQAPVEEPPARPPIPTSQPRGVTGRESSAQRERPAVPPRPRRTEPRLD
ncbi:hypothetical protein [Acidocella aminolytica]|uniref:Uncharacterized protein n=1 Tax=Acidocella aminolytica 101 = DSM 11237 TaxID=1120923 RepID=A0A0D6PBQ3_9PROT|nr:hypothetical protein [Acidocella aminolytica]GAN78786.1 hypothetical protein Aam_007_073 [Acidocella aminolytica 101 = DSM 11237]GBQ36183.1 hypothetical protein AA11237_1175 [Acidocella aminolytica 101 = DSM 11237]SHE80102.1 hypothetical protein SAMN02746095_01248 [Acidocella aminolytica 101 = DSM 11237]